MTDPHNRESYQMTDAGNPIDVTPEDWAEANRFLAKLAQSVSPAWFATHRDNARRQFAVAAAAKRKATHPIADGPCGCVVMGDVRAMPVFAGRSAAPSGPSRQGASWAKPAAAIARRSAL